jgi:formiminotetrahydrofolate cyclodeaminase
MTLIDRPLGELLDAFSSADPTPGGGSASALASAIGASLLLMVAGLPKTRSNTPEDREALDRAKEELTILRRDLADAVDADTAAYDQVVAAYRLPKGSAEEQQARKTAVQHALRAAIDVPLGVIRLSILSLRQALVVAKHGHAAAASDVGVAAALLEAGAVGAKLNVQINLAGITDAAYGEGLRVELGELEGEIPAVAAAVSAAISC